MGMGRVGSKRGCWWIAGECDQRVVHMTGSSLWSPEVKKAGREDPQVTSRPKFSWVPGMPGFQFFLVLETGHITVNQIPSLSSWSVSFSEETMNK